jgi:hypothetical protein
MNNATRRNLMHSRRLLTELAESIDFLDEADARISAVRLGMGEEAWEEAFRKGRAMTLDEAISYALEEAGT